MQPGTAGPDNRLGCCFISFHFLWATLCPQAVQVEACGHEHTLALLTRCLDATYVALAGYQIICLRRVAGSLKPSHL